MAFDVVGSLIVWLRPQVTEPIYPRVPRSRPDAFHVLRRLGGPFDHPVIDVPTVGLESWAKTEAQAHTNCQEVRALIHSLRGATLNGVAVYRVDEFAGPAWLPDPNSDQPRFVATFSIRHREHLAVT